MKKIYKTIPVKGDFISLALTQTENNEWHCEMFVPAVFLPEMKNIVNKKDDINPCHKYVDFYCKVESEIKEKIKAYLNNIFGEDINFAI